MSKKIKVLIVDDSAIARQLLTYIIESDPQLTLIGCAQDGEEALNLVKKLSPDVITMDLIMPKIDGYQTTKNIMQIRPTPIVIISTEYAPYKTDLSFNAIEAGALAILEKPYGLNDKERISEIVETIKAISTVKLKEKNAPLSPQMEKMGFLNENAPLQIEAVAMGASLGGPQTCNHILAALDDDFPVPIFIVQHIAKGFVEGLVEWLKKFTKLKLKVAQHGEKALPGHVYFAPDKCQMKVNNKKEIIITESEEQPTVSNLFASIAESFGSKSIGVLLTGMGNDGAKELLTMRQKGAITIVQEEKDCIMFGMPKAAISLDAAKYILSVSQISSALEKLVGIRSNNGTERPSRN